MLKRVDLINLNFRIRNLEYLCIRDCPPDLTQIIDYSMNLKAIELKNMASNLKAHRITPKMDFRPLTFLHLSVENFISDFYDGFNMAETGKLASLLRIFSKTCPSLVGLRVPLPFTPQELAEIPLAQLDFPSGLLYLELRSFSAQVYVDLRRVETIPVRYLSLIDVYVKPVSEAGFYSNYWNRNDIARGPLLCLGGASEEMTVNIYEHVVKHRP